MLITHPKHIARVQVEVRKGNRHAAKKQYEKLLGKALRGFGPSEHWAHAEYAWLLYEDGLREQALHHLQAAIDVSGLGDTSVDPAEVASYHYKLGRVLWETKAKGCEHTPLSLRTPPPPPQPTTVFSRYMYSTLM